MSRSLSRFIELSCDGLLNPKIPDHDDLCVAHKQHEPGNERKSAPPNISLNL